MAKRRLGIDLDGPRATSAIYQIRLISDNRRYVGSAIDVAGRWSLHWRQLERGKHHSLYLQRAWDKHGADAFAFEILELVAPEREALLAAEQRWIDSLQPVFNMSPTAGSSLGMKRRPETRAAVSAAVMELWQDPSYRQRMSEAHKGKNTGPRPPEVGQAISKAKGGRKTGGRQKQDFCKNGHPLSDPNLYYSRKGTTIKRTCRQCVLDDGARRRRTARANV